MAQDIHLVTGAGGRTGLALCAELKSRGLSVRALNNDRTCLPFVEQYADEVLAGDIRRPEDLDAVFSGAAYVYHLAGIVSIASRTDKRVEEVNVRGTANVIDACLKHRIKRLVYTGTVHTLPFRDTASVLREVDRYDPALVDGPYAKSKAVASNLVLDAVRDRGLDAVLGLPSGIVGGFEIRRSNFGQMIVDVAERHLPAYVTGRYDFVDVRDVASALADLAFRGAAGESYILSGHIVDVKELVRLAAEAAGVRPPGLCLPLPLVKFFAAFAECYALLRKKTLVFTPYALKVLGDNCNFSHDKISALTGYDPRPVPEAIREQVEYYFNVYKPHCAKTRLV